VVTEGLDLGRVVDPGRVLPEQPRAGRERELGLGAEGAEVRQLLLGAVGRERLLQGIVGGAPATALRAAAANPVGRHERAVRVEDPDLGDLRLERAAGELVERDPSCRRRKAGTAMLRLGDPGVESALWFAGVVCGDAAKGLGGRSSMLRLWATGCQVMTSSASAGYAQAMCV